VWASYTFAQTHCIIEWTDHMTNFRCFLKKSHRRIHFAATRRRGQLLSWTRMVADT
jgi:hypothetical protein